VPFAGQQAIVAPVIFIGPKGAECLKDPEKAIFTEICEHLPKNTKPLCKFWSQIEYAVSYLKWSSWACEAAYKRIEGTTPMEQCYNVDQTLINMSIRLVCHYPLEFLRYLTRTFLLSYFVPERYGYGGILILLAAVLCLFAHIYRDSEDRDRMLLGGAITLFFANILLVALFEPLLSRYTVYTDIFLGAVIVSIVASWKPRQSISA
jgi:hypothetical protein